MLYYEGKEMMGPSHFISKRKNKKTLEGAEIGTHSTEVSIGFF